MNCSVTLTFDPPSFLADPFEGRATIEGATVTLRGVTQADAGEYRCEISAPLDSVSLGETNVTLKVLGTTQRNAYRAIIANIKSP